MKKVFILILTLFIVPLTLVGVTSEKIDSLKAKITTSTGEKKIQSLIVLADYYNMGDIETGLEYVDEACSLAVEAHYDLQLASAKLIRGGLLIRKGEYDAAEHDLSQSAQYFQASKQDSLLAKVYSNIGLLNRSKGDLDKALEYYKKSLKIKQNFDDKPGIASTLSGIGLVYLDKGELTRAKEYLEEAMQILENYDKPTSLSHIILNLGLINLRLGKYEEAMTYYKKGLALAEKYDFKLIQASIYNNMANVYFTLGDLVKAKEVLYDALDIYRSIGNKQNIARIINNLSILLEKEGKFEEAIKLYQEALEIRKELGNKLELANSYRNIGGLYSELNENNKTIEYLEEAYDLYSEIDNKPYQAEVLTEIGDQYLLLKNYSSAIETLSRAYQQAKEQNNITLLDNITASLASAYYEVDEYNNAYQFQKENSTIKDSINIARNTEDLNKLRVQYETEKKDQENQILSQDLAISQLEKDRLSYFLFGAFLLLAIIIFFFVSRIKINQKLKFINKDLEIAKENSEQMREQIALVNKILRHDLTNSFVVIQSALNLFNENHEDEMLQEIGKRCEQSLQLIKKMRMLEVGRKNADDLQVIDLDDIFTILTEKFHEPSINVKGNSLVLADEALESVFTNLIDNARQHGNATEVKISVEESLEFTIITLTNNGEAIKEKLINEIFDEGVTSGGDGHTGMGLFLVRQNINRYGGSIVLSTNEDHHVSFEINLKKANP